MREKSRERIEQVRTVTQQKESYTENQKMAEARQKHRWSEFLKFFSEQNEGKRTRIGVFEEGNDYWLESGLPLTGVDVDTRSDRPAIEIVLGTFTHTARDVVSMKFLFSESGEEDGLDLTGADGKTTILRFEAGP